MLRRMPSRVFAGWLAYMRVEPFGAMREDFRIGSLWSLIVNMFARRKGETAVPWHALFPEHDPRRAAGRRRPSPAVVWQTLVASARTAGLYRETKE